MSSRSRGHFVISPQLHFRIAIRPGVCRSSSSLQAPSLSQVSHKKLSLVYGRFVQHFPLTQFAKEACLRLDPKTVQTCLKFVFTPQFHMINEVRPTTEEGTVWCLGQERDSALGIAGAFVAERPHGSTSLIAGMMLVSDREVPPLFRSFFSNNLYNFPYNTPAQGFEQLSQYQCPHPIFP